MRSILLDVIKIFKRAVHNIKQSVYLISWCLAYRSITSWTFWAVHQDTAHSSREWQGWYLTRMRVGNVHVSHINLMDHSVWLHCVQNCIEFQIELLFRTKSDGWSWSIAHVVVCRVQLVYVCESLWWRKSVSMRAFYTRQLVSHSRNIASSSDETLRRHLYSLMDDCRSLLSICLFMDEVQPCCWWSYHNHSKTSWERNVRSMQQQVHHSTSSFIIGFTSAWSRGKRRLKPMSLSSLYSTVYPPMNT